MLIKDNGNMSSLFDRLEEKGVVKVDERVVDRKKLLSLDTYDWSIKDNVALTSAIIAAIENVDKDQRRLTPEMKVLLNLAGHAIMNAKSKM